MFIFGLGVGFVAGVAGYHWRGKVVEYAKVLYAKVKERF